MLLDVVPPRVRVLDQQMHHEMVGVLLVVEVLQQETRIATAQIGEMVRRPGELEAEILIEPLGQGKVLRGHVGLGLDRRHGAHAIAPVDRRRRSPSQRSYTATVTVSYGFNKETFGFVLGSGTAT